MLVFHSQLMGKLQRYVAWLLVNKRETRDTRKPCPRPSLGVSHSGDTPGFSSRNKDQPHLLQMAPPHCHLILWKDACVLSKLHLHCNQHTYAVGTHLNPITDSIAKDKQQKPRLLLFALPKSCTDQDNISFPRIHDAMSCVTNKSIKEVHDLWLVVLFLI